MITPKLINFWPCLVVFLCLTGLVLTGGFGQAQSATVVRIEIGENGKSSVLVENVVDLFGFELTLYFDPDAISVSALTLGDFLEPGMSPVNEVDNNNGIIRYDMTQVGETTPSQSGSGALIEFEVTQLNPSLEPRLIIGHILLTDRNGVEIPCEVLSSFSYWIYLPLIRN